MYTHMYMYTHTHTITRILSSLPHVPHNKTTPPTFEKSSAVAIRTLDRLKISQKSKFLMFYGLFRSELTFEKSSAKAPHPPDRLRIFQSELFSF